MKKALIFGAAALGAAAMGRRGQRSRKIFLAMQGLPNQGRRAARPRTYKTLAGLSRAMGDRTLSLDEIHSQRAYLKGKGWSPINYRLTYADATEIAKVLGGRKDTQRDVRNGLLYGRIGDLPYSTRQRITWDKHGWGYVAGQDYRAETARIRKILKK